MSTVFRQVQHTDLLEAVSSVIAYKEHCEAGPAWKKTYTEYQQRPPAAQGSCLDLSAGISEMCAFKR